MKSEKSRVLILALLLFAVCSVRPLEARRKSRGAEVAVTLREGGRVAGELLAVRDGALLVVEAGTAQVRRIGIPEVDEVRAKRKSRFSDGFVLGAIVGGILAERLNRSYCDCEIGPRLRNIALCPTLGGLAGGMALNSLRPWKRFRLAGVPPEAVQATLEELRLKAREPGSPRTGDETRSPGR